MNYLLENRVNDLLPWVEKRLRRAIDRSDTKVGFNAVRLMDKLRSMEVDADPAISRDKALDRIQRRLHLN